MNPGISEKNSSEGNGSLFYKTLENSLSKRQITLAQIYEENDSVSQRILHEYGAIFLAVENVLPPPVCMFTSAGQVDEYHAKIEAASEEINGVRISLQAEAMKAFLSAREEARAAGADIRPRGGAEAAKRGYEDTLRLWKSRFEPACMHWLEKGRLTAEQIERLAALEIKEQVREVLELEKEGIYFNTFFNNSILYSVAAPGASQHLSMLALDIEEFANPEIRKIMGNHGWFRTVKNDAPHFTFLGKNESELPSLGLKKIENKDGEFWVPDI